MPDIVHNTINKQIYTAGNGSGNMLAQVSRVLLCIAPGSLLAGGFNDKGELLTARYNHYDEQNWVPDFFEHQFINEPLLSDNSKPVTIFMSADKNMLVPKALYKEGTAEEWFRKTWFVGLDETIYTHHLREDKASYLYTIPAHVQELASRYFPKAKYLPFAAHQFNKAYKSGNIFQCTVNRQQVYLTLYKGKALQWHHVYSYANAEEIAYYIKHAAKEYGIEQYTLQFATDNAGMEPLATALTSYFPDMIVGNKNIADEDWRAAIYLLQQLYACV